MSEKIIAQYVDCHGRIELFAQQGPEALELLASSPLLGFCLAVNDRFRKGARTWPMAAARQYMARPQREILDWLGFTPATEAVAKIARKCEPSSLTVGRCFRLQKAITDDHVREMLAHLPRINAGVIGLVSDRDLQPLLTPKFLGEVACDPTENRDDAVVGLVTDIRRMHRLVHRQEPLPALVSLRRAKMLHDKLIVELNHRRPRPLRCGEFPTPPVLGVARDDLIISPIATVDELRALGRAQHNCVASYASRVKRGKDFIYRVVAEDGETYTLCLSKTRDGRWPVSEFKGLCNRPAPHSVLQEVNRWLTDNKVVWVAAPEPDLETDSVNQHPIPTMTVDGLTITPLTRRAALTTHGNALRSHAQHIQSGQVYVYQVVAPPSLYLVLIGRVRGKGWRLRGVYTEGGLPSVRGDVLVTLARWLDRARGRAQESVRFCAAGSIISPQPEE